MNKHEVTIILSELIQLNLEELQERFKDKKTKGLELLVISIIIKGVRQGDQCRLNCILDRLIGKATQPVEIGGPDGGSISYSDITNEEINEKFKNVERRLKKYYSNAENTDSE